MNNQQKQFLSLYQTYRHDDQIEFYDLRSEEFEKANTQAIYLTATLMILTAIVSLLIAASLFEPKWVLAVLGVFLPALSTALTAYTTLCSFEPQSKLYRDALNALRKAKASALEPELATDIDVDAKLAAYVNQVEEIFRKEQGQWGQLISEIKPVDPSNLRGQKK